MPKTSTSRRKGRSKSTSPPEITTFPNAVRYLMERTDYERMRIVRYNEKTFKLDRMKTILDGLGNPHEQVRMVHVAGTVGKGSTVAMISSMLQGCGYAVGQYTSPHLDDVRERISINGQLIAKNEFTDLMKEAVRVADKAGIDPTYFELLTAIGFQYFAEQAVDIAVIEVGLGGRLDSTNVITPEVTVFTQIDFDHMNILGHTLEKIAREKAGIIKRGVPVVTFDQHQEVQDVLAEAAQKAGAPVRMINGDIEFSSRFGASDDLGPHTRICVVTESSQFMHLPVPLPGEHQAINCALALAVIDTLKSSGFEFSEVPLHDGLAKTSTPGRMELVWDSPRILVDGAHNAAALGALMRCVGAQVPYDSMGCVFGCCEDKDVGAMLEKIALGADKIIFTRTKRNPRAADPEELQRQFCEISGKMNQFARTLPEALDLAAQAVSQDDLICVTGSFYLVGEAKKYLAEVDRKHHR